MPDRDDLDAVIAEMLKGAEMLWASEVTSVHHFGDAIKGWADRLDACITSAKLDTNSEVEAVAHAIDDAIYPEHPWAANTDDAPQPRTVAEAAIAALDASRGETGSPEPSDEAVEAALVSEGSAHIAVVGCTCPWDDDGNPPSSCRCGERREAQLDDDVRSILRAAYAVDRPASPAPREEAHRLHRLRTGRKVGRTIYVQLGVKPSDADGLVGMVDTPALAAALVRAYNAREEKHPVQRDVEDFHRVVVGVPDGETPAVRRPGLRAELIREEAKETVDAIEAGDLVGAIDGMCDVLCVVYGTAAEFGINLAPFWDEVHRTNMAKAGGPLREDGKRLKPEGWTPPDIAGVLAREEADDG